MEEWNHNKRWNPFNSYKLLAHVDKWKKIKRGALIPSPILVTVDPTNRCNLKCEWCNADYVMEKNNNELSHTALMKIADFLPYWTDFDGVKAVCIAGGGEPLLNQNVGDFIDRLISNGIEVGVVTNGSLMHRFLEPLSKCTWVGVSVDAGSKEMYKNLKHGDFDRVIQNIETLREYSTSQNSTLAMDRPAYGISYKYLLYKENVKEIYAAANLAKEIGCKNIHFRPAGTPWDKIGSGGTIAFDSSEISEFESQISKAMDLNDSNFGVYGVTHKFNTQFDRENHFSKCYAVFMTAVFEPPTETGDGFSLGLCCDRRGDEKLELLHNHNNPSDIKLLWGGVDHWDIHDRIMVTECPRCTYQPHNEIYEQVILKDSMTHKFI